MGAAPEGASILESDSPASSYTASWSPHQLGPRPPSSLANATYKITEKKVYIEGAFS